MSYAKKPRRRAGKNYDSVPASFARLGRGKPLRSGKRIAPALSDKARNAIAKLPRTLFLVDQKGFVRRMELDADTVELGKYFRILYLPDSSADCPHPRVVSWEKQTKDGKMADGRVPAHVAACKRLDCPSCGKRRRKRYIARMIREAQAAYALGHDIKLAQITPEPDVLMRPAMSDIYSRYIRGPLLTSEDDEAKAAHEPYVPAEFQAPEIGLSMLGRIPLDIWRAIAAVETDTSLTGIPLIDEFRKRHPDLMRELTLPYCDEFERQNMARLHRAENNGLPVRFRHIAVRQANHEEGTIGFWHYHILLFCLTRKGEPGYLSEAVIQGDGKMNSKGFIRKGAFRCVAYVRSVDPAGTLSAITYIARYIAREGDVVGISKLFGGYCKPTPEGSKRRFEPDIEAYAAGNRIDLARYELRDFDLPTARKAKINAK